MDIPNKINYSFEQNKKCEESNFDSVLKEKWNEAQKKGVFRYILNIRNSKVLDGKYQFFVQLNIDRGYSRRSPENITSMTQPFDEKSFNFTKIAPEEEIMNLDNGSEENVIAVNVSPIEYCHSLLLPQKCKKLPQVVTKYSLYKAVEIFSLSCSLDIRVIFNSLCAYASVNHLHWHLYYLKQRMLLEYIDLEDYADYLQRKQIAHNVYITRAKSNNEEYGDLRIYIWARKFSTGIKDISAFNPAVCELFGHVTVKSEEVYNSLTEEYIANILEDITEECFSLVFDELKELIQKQMRKGNENSIKTQ
ncbi:GDP-D-glucose phosphorylase 1 isoform X2 [Calliopsis andreniformis]|uniref:GDP-D-glucose phosphorylase 1 isoform X2 n=1 Tax=Calliopsis andreniformis TaxID=337506 RepID=UPI003FCE27F1